MSWTIRRSLVVAIASAAIIVAAGLWVRSYVPRSAVRVLVGSWPRQNIDPLKYSVMGEWFLLENLYSTLVEPVDELTIGSGIAESWSRNRDGTVWTFRLRGGLRWSDGSRMQVEEVVASLNRASMGAPHVKMTAYVESIRSQDQRTIEIRLSQPVENFLNSLSMVEFSIVHPQAYARSFSWSQPVSGAFIVRTFNEKEYRLERNKHYWDTPEGCINGVTVVRGHGDDRDIDSLLYGEEFDLAKLSPGTLTSPRLVKLLSEKYQMYSGRADFLALLSFSSKRVANGQLPLPLRRALISKIYDGFWSNDVGWGTRASGMRPPAARGALSPEEFQQILAAHRLFTVGKTRKKLQVMIWQAYFRRDTVQTALRALKALPVEVEVTVEDTQRYLARKNVGDYDLRVGYLSTSLNDPDTDWRMYNREYFAMPVATEAELDQALLETSSTRRLGLYKEFERRALRDALYVPLLYEGSFLVASDRILLDQRAAASWGLPLNKLRIRRLLK